MHTPPNDPIPVPDKPFPSENETAERSARVLKQQRKNSGGLEDSSEEGEAKVVNDTPFKNLRSG